MLLTRTDDILRCKWIRFESKTLFVAYMSSIMSVRSYLHVKTCFEDLGCSEVENHCSMQSFCCPPTRNLKIETFFTENSFCLFCFARLVKGQDQLENSFTCLQLVISNLVKDVLCASASLSHVAADSHVTKNRNKS